MDDLWINAGSVEISTVYPQVIHKWRVRGGVPRWGRGGVKVVGASPPHPLSLCPHGQRSQALTVSGTIFCIDKDCLLDNIIIMSDKPTGIPIKTKSASKVGRPKGSLNIRTKMLQNLENLFTGDSEEGKDSFIKEYLENFKESAKSGGWAAKPLWDAIAGKDPVEAIDRILSKSRREDADFNSYRVLLDCHDVQKEIVLSSAKRLYAMAGRRAGKTQANIRRIIHQLSRQSNQKFLIIHLTITKAIEQYFNAFLETMDHLGIEVVGKSLTDGHIKLKNGGEIYLRGNNTKDEREKFRGDQWDGIIIEEAQSQKALYYLIDEVLTPTLLDRKGWLMLSGTGPRIRGTAWEKLFFGARDDSSRGRTWNWNISHNHFIPDYEKVLEDIKMKNGWTDNTPIFVREYLGQVSYDDDALVIRLGPENFYDDSEIRKWVNSQPVTDLHFTAGLDFGFTDSDGFVIVLYSDSRPEKWVVHQYKKNRIGTEELAHAIKNGIDQVLNSPLFQSVQDRYIQVYADSSHGITSFDLNAIYGLPVTDAYKQNKDLAYENLQNDARRGFIKLRHAVFNDEGICVANPLEDECNKTVFRRNDEESPHPYELTREIDDEAYHPDLMDALLYALRRVWVYTNYNENGEIEETTEKAWFDKNQTLPSSMRM